MQQFSKDTWQSSGMFENESEIVNARLFSNEARAYVNFGKSK